MNPVHERLKEKFSDIESRPLSDSEKENIRIMQLNSIHEITVCHDCSKWAHMLRMGCPNCHSLNVYYTCRTYDGRDIFPGVNFCFYPDDPELYK